MSKDNRKTYVLTVAKTFQKGHPREGEPTNFKEKILSGEKTHTIRMDEKMYWRNAAKEVNQRKAIISIRQWSGKPYCSPQDPEFMRVEHMHVQTIIDHRAAFQVGDKWRNVTVKTIASNDGLSEADLLAWFGLKIVGKHFDDHFVAQILHFTNMIY